MQESKEVRSDTVGSNGVKKMRSRGESDIRRARRAIKILKLDPDWPDEDADVAELSRIYVPHSMHEEFDNVVNSKSYREVRTGRKYFPTSPKTPPENVKTSLDRRKFFRTSPGKPTRSINGVCNGTQLASSSTMEFGDRKAILQLIKSTSHVTRHSGGSIDSEGKINDTLLGKGNASEEIVLSDLSLSNNGRSGSMQTHCTPELHVKRAGPGTPIRVNGIHEESRIQKEIWAARDAEPRSCSKRKASPMKNRTVKVRKVDGNSDDDKRSTQSYRRTLLEDRSEKCEKIVGDVDELQNSLNGRIVSRSESATEAVESEQEIYVKSLSKRIMSTVEDGCKGHLSVNVMDSDSKSTTNCNAVESTTVPDASCSVSKTSSVNSQRALCAVSPSLQPVVVLRKLTFDEIRHYTPERLMQSEEISQKCVESESTELSSEESLLSSAEEFDIKFYGRDRKRYRKCYGRKRKSLKCILPSSGEKYIGQSCEQDSPGQGSEAGVCGAAAADKPQSEGSSRRICNGVKECAFDRSVGRNDVKDTVFENGNDEVSSNSIVSSCDTSTAKRTPAFTVLGADSRKCCGNVMCQVATPELIGLENPITSNRCWMNVTLQTLFSMESFMRSMIKASGAVNAEGNSLISCILTIYYARYLGHQECVYEQARKLTEVLGMLNSNYILNDQQDPSEFILWLFNAIEPALKEYGPSWASSLITKYFRFEMEERTCCTGCMKHGERVSSFLILMLDIDVGTSKIRTIQEALAAYTSTKTVSRPCTLCGEERSMVKTAFKSLPRYLIINLKRYSVKEGEVVRDETPVRHSSTLSLGKYLFPKDRRSVAVASPPTLNNSRKNLRRVAERDYHLISIIHHSGFSVSSGHYVCDVYHASTKQWYSYNDKMVKEISEVTLSSTKRQKTGYIYVYQSKYC